MKQELIVEKYINSKKVKSFKLQEDQSLSLGRSRKCNIRVAGGVSGTIRNLEGEWSFLGDNGEVESLSDAWGERFDKETQLKFKTYTKDSISLETKGFSGQGKEAHLVIVKKKGQIVFTQILAREQSFFDERYVEVPIENSTGQKQTLNYKNCEVVSQIIKVPEDFIFFADKKTKSLSSRKKTLSFGVAILLIVLTFKITFMSANNKKDEIDLKTNKYTKMVYDSEEFSKARSRVENLLKENFDVESSPIQSSDSVVENNSGAAQEVVSQLKKSGIQELVRSIASQGVVSASSIKVKEGAGTRVKQHLARSKSGIGGAKESKGKAYKLGGVKTAGVLNIGSKSALKKMGGLAKGKTGEAKVNVLEEETVIQGGLEPEVIAGVIRKYLGEVRYCYERQLSRNNELEGKIQVNFAIGADGSVSWQKIAKTTLNNAMVEGCILRRVVKWKFPEPKGGTSVHVTYPFLLRSIN